MSFADGARRSLERNRAMLKQRKEKFRFRRMFPKSSMRSKSFGDFIKTKVEYRKKLKGDELSHWKRVVGLTVLAFSILFLLFKYGFKI